MTATDRRGLLSIEEAADYLGIAAGTLRNWISLRRIDHVKVGRLTKVPLSVLDRYITSNTVRHKFERDAYIQHFSRRNLDAPARGICRGVQGDASGMGLCG